MQSDEEQIRQLLIIWTKAIRAGDVDTVLNLVAEDVVFLMPGRPPMCKTEFATVLRAQSSQITLKIDGTSEIQEIKVVGDWAFMWSKRRVVATPPDCSPTLERAAHTLIVLKKERARWVLARNANLFAPVQRPQLHDQP